MKKENKKLSHKARLTAIKIAVVLAAVLLLLAPAGSSTPQVNMYSMVTSMGIDKGENGVICTAEVILPVENSGAKGESIIIQGEGFTLSSAIENLSISLGRTLDISHCALFVVGREKAEEGVLEELNFLLSAGSVSPEMSVVLSGNKDAAEFLHLLNGYGEKLDLDNLIKYMDYGSHNFSQSLLLFLNETYSKSGTAVMPCIKMGDKAENRNAIEGLSLLGSKNADNGVGGETNTSAKDKAGNDNETADVNRLENKSGLENKETSGGTNENNSGTNNNSGGATDGADKKEVGSGGRTSGESGGGSSSGTSDGTNQNNSGTSGDSDGTSDGTNNNSGGASDGANKKEVGSGGKSGGKSEGSSSGDSKESGGGGGESEKDSDDGNEEKNGATVVNRTEEIGIFKNGRLSALWGAREAGAIALRDIKTKNGHLILTDVQVGEHTIEKISCYLVKKKLKTSLKTEDGNPVLVYKIHAQFLIEERYKVYGAGEVGKRIPKDAIAAVKKEIEKSIGYSLEKTLERTKTENLDAMLIADNFYKFRTKEYREFINADKNILENARLEIIFDVKIN